jgi:hypothetical protein
LICYDAAPGLHTYIHNSSGVPFTAASSVSVSAILVLISAATLIFPLQFQFLIKQGILVSTLSAISISTAKPSSPASVSDSAVSAISVSQVSN